MSQRPNTEQQGAVAVYDDNTRSGGSGRVPVRNERNVDLNVVTPTDRVRWGPILAGLFTAITSALLFTLLALAWGAAVAGPNSTARSFGIGSGIAAALIWLVAFGLGGYVAARTMALPGRSNGFFNGLMVSLVGIPLLLYALGSLFSSLLGTAGSVASNVAQAVAPVAGAAATNPSAQAAASDAAGSAAAAAPSAASAAASAVGSAAATVQQNAEEISDTAATVGFGSLVPPALALIASGLGGLAGARKPEEDELDIRA